MSFADKLRDTKQESILLNGKEITGEKSIKKAKAAESIAGFFRQYAQEQASYGKTKCKAYFGDGGFSYATGGGRSHVSNDFYFSFTSACTVSGYVKELLQEDGYNSLSVRPQVRNGFDSSSWFIKIVATW